MAKTIALIACPNGLGHVRRMYVLGEQLVRHGWRVTVFAPSEKILKVGRALGIRRKFFLNDFDARFDIPSLRQGLSETLFWERRLPSLDQFDIVVSDNLPEVLDLRTDAILSGNFLWHQVLSDIPNCYRGRAGKLIKEHRPPILSYGGFSIIDKVAGVQVLDCAIPAIEDDLDLEVNQKNSLLVTCGTTGNIKAQFKEFILDLVMTGIEPFTKVFVEPGLLADFNYSGFYAADFSIKMFSSVGAIIGRPGFGAITDSIYCGAKFFAVFEEKNLEMKKNAELLQKKGLGGSYSTADQAWSEAKKFAMDEHQQGIFSHNRMEIVRLNRKLPTVLEIVEAR